MRQDTPWTGQLKFRDKQAHTQVHTYAQFRVSSPELHGCGLSEEVGVFGGNLRKHREEMQTPPRKALAQVTALTAAPSAQTQGNFQFILLRKTSRCWHISVTLHLINTTGHFCKCLWNLFWRCPFSCLPTLIFSVFRWETTQFAFLLACVERLYSQGQKLDSILIYCLIELTH